MSEIAKKQPIKKVIKKGVKQDPEVIKLKTLKTRRTNIQKQIEQALATGSCRNCSVCANIDI
jgi:hypothetical protein